MCYYAEGIRIGLLQLLFFFFLSCVAGNPPRGKVTLPVSCDVFFVNANFQLYNFFIVHVSGCELELLVSLRLQKELTRPVVAWI